MRHVTIKLYQGILTVAFAKQLSKAFLAMVNSVCSAPLPLNTGSLDSRSWVCV